MIELTIVLGIVALVFLLLASPITQGVLRRIIVSQAASILAARHMEEVASEQSSSLERAARCQNGYIDGTNQETP